MNKAVDFGRLLHGGDYNPEQWLDMPEILEKDIAYFKKAHINEVSMGIFSWSVLEPEEGVYNLDWMGEIIDKLYENGIYTMLATPSAAKPKWMADKYPEVLRVDPTGHRAKFGGRHNHCYTSPVYREKIRAINMKLAERFGHHPGVIAWHISNELEGSPYPCHCDLCQVEFRTFLKKRYGTIDKLNKAWATTFWSHIYNDFDQIEAPSPNGEMALHGLNLDWKGFVTGRVIDFLRHETKALRDAGSGLPTTVNMMYDFGPLNYRKFADEVDFVSWDNYPAWHKRDDAITAMKAGFQHDFIRSIKKQPFYMMESCPGATNWQPVSKLKRPGMRHGQSMQAIAHGSDSVQYFQLRKSRGASEKFHGAVIDHYGGDDTRTFLEVTQVGVTLEALGEVRCTMPSPAVALVYDWENKWAMEDAAGPRNEGLFYKASVQKSYSAFRKLGLDVDVIDMEQSLDGYQIVVAPMLYMFRAGFEEKVRSFVEAGGRFVLSYWSGIVDDTDLCFLGGTPHGLMDVFGLRSTEIDSLFDGETNAGKDENGNTYTCTHLCDLVKCSTARVLMTYTDDFYAGWPALTENDFGKGKGYYVCADFEQKFYDDFYQKLVEESGIARVMTDIPHGIEVTTRKNDEHEYVFIQNFNQKPTEVKLPLEEYQVLIGEYDGTIKAYQAVVLKRLLV